MVSESEAALARAVLIHGPLSRSALTKRLSLSPASLTRLAKPLLDSGILIELGDTADGTVGRPSRPLDIAPDVGGFVGVKLTGDRIYAVATDVRAEPIAETERALSSTDPGEVIEAIVELVAGFEVRKLRGIGVSLGGLSRDGVVVDAPFLDWHDVALAEPLAQRLGVPVTLENDLVALAEAERWFGVGRGIPGFAVITVGIGVGYALVVDGQVVHTPDSGVGTGGHIPVAPNGPLCSEGHRGCTQAMLTSGSVAAQVSAALQRPVTFDEVLDAASLGEPAARAVVDASAAALGRLIALATNLTLQHTVVLAGEGVGLYDRAADVVADAIRADRAAEAAPVNVHVDRTGFRAWARGAAAVAIQAAVDRLAG